MLTDYAQLINRFGGAAVDEYLEYNPEIREEIEQEVSDFFAAIQTPVPYENIESPVVADRAFGKDVFDSQLYYESEEAYHAKVTPAQAVEILQEKITEAAEREALIKLDDKASALPWWAD